MKALFLGLGSIGQRHLRNLKKIAPDTEIIAYRSKKIVPFLNESNEPEKNLDIVKHYKIQEYTSLREALKENPKMVFVTNPSNLHAISAIKALKANSFVFIEKPLSFDLKVQKNS